MNNMSSYWLMLGMWLSLLFLVVIVNVIVIVIVIVVVVDSMLNNVELIAVKKKVEKNVKWKIK